MTMLTAKYNLTFQQGKTVNQQFRLLIADGSPFDLSGYAIDSQVRAEVTSPSASATFFCNPVAPTDGTFALQLTPSQSMTLTGSCYYYDVRISSGSNVYFPLEGKVTVSRVVTR